MKEKSAVYEGNRKALVAAILLIVLIFSAAYAFFTSYNNANGKYNVGIGEGLDLAFTLHAEGDLNLTINPGDFKESNIGASVSSKASGSTVTLVNNTDYEEILCRYEVWYTPTNTFTNSSANSSGEVELALSGKEVSGNSFSDFNLNAVNKATKVGTGVITAKTGVTSTQDWTFTLSHYNRDFNQNGHIGKSYGGKISFKSLGCDEPQTLSDTVIALQSSNDYTSSQDNTPYRVANQNGVRYEGKNPDNYVTYNGELWRIIGVFDGIDIGLESGKKYTKIARSTPLDTPMAWDNDNETYENDWKNSTLNAYLNGTYLNGLTTEAKESIATYNGKYSTWHLLGPTWDEFETYYTPDMYRAERDTTVGKRGYRNGVADSADPSIEAAIGLMYPSDYGYAAYGTNCNNETTDTLYYYETTCGAVDWLLYPNGWEWLISPGADYSNSAFSVYGDRGGYVDNLRVNGEHAVRPVLYLEVDVVVASGDGSEASPYKLYKEYNPTYLSDAILAKAEESAGANITSETDGTIYRIVDQNGVRYEGKNPDNYVEFNNEEWRIIGVFDGTDIGLEASKKYTKIARSTPLDTPMAWDNDNGTYENDWKNSTLNAYLNGTYLNGLTTEAKESIATYNNKYSTWHLLGPTWSEFETYYTPDMYRAERDTTVGKRGYRNGVADSADPSIEAAIGLMYPSDYGYAAYGTNCNNETTDTLYYYETTCGEVDWLLYPNGWEWLISPRAAASDLSFIVDGDGGGYVVSDYVNREFAVRPVLYLEASVTITGGTGQKGSNAYKLG